MSSGSLTGGRTTLILDVMGSHQVYMALLVLAYCILHYSLDVQQAMRMKAFYLLPQANGELHTTEVSHPAAQGSILGVLKNFYLELVEIY